MIQRYLIGQSTAFRLPSVLCETRGAIHFGSLPFFSRCFCASKTEVKEGEKSPLFERVVDLSKGEVFFKLSSKAKLPYSVWKEVHSILTPNDFCWKPKERYWVSASTPMSENASLKAKEYLEKVEGDFEGISEKEREALRLKWAEAEDSFVAKCYPVAHERVQKTLEEAPVNVQTENQLNVLITDILTQVEEILPKGINQKRYTALLKEAFEGIENLLEFDSGSVQKASLTAAALGLEPNTILQQCYFIPFDKKLHFVIGYKGLIELSMRSGDAIFFDARCVYKRDNFEVSSPPNVQVWHVPYEDSKNRGDIVSVYALRRTKNGETDVAVLGAEDLKKYQQISRSGKGKSESSPWNSWTEEMCIKTAVKSLTKRTELAVERK